ncbi:hypothetical protein Sste5346_005271 [Sporothrix stenoceras]|uniref:Uncharacterized protein n=1 Tax=Sporothrix stenoceras TaxID=5173 RepID=A0ABR3Z499_9PEZI
MPGSPQHEFHMPGAYHFDNPQQQPSSSSSFTRTGADVFLPPAVGSPADSTYLDLTRSAGSLYSDFSTIPAGDHGGKRKRAAQDSREGTPLGEWDASTVNGRDTRRAPPSYTLAGQIDVHGAATTHDTMDESVYSDVEYRRALGPTGAMMATTTADTTDAERWTVLHALGNVVGKVWEFCTTGAFRGFHAGGGAGYDWETGKPEAAAVSVATATDQSTSDAFTEKSTVFVAEPTTPRETTPQRTGKRRQVSLNAGDELGRSWVIVDQKRKQAHPQTQTPRRPAVKVPLRNGRASTSATPAATAQTPDRRTTSYTRSGTTVTPGTAASRRINTPISRMGTTTTTTTTTTHRRGASGASTARISYAGSPSLSSREPASFASPRSSTPVGGATIASPRRPYASTNYNSPGGSRIPQPGTDFNNYNPFSRAAAASPRPGSCSGRSSSMAFGATGSPAKNGHSHRRSHSGRVGMSPLPKKTIVKNVDNDNDSVIGITESPRLTDEAKRLAAQNLAAEQESDAKMEAFNLRLQQMIRQGQEALGTTFEVDGDDDGGGDDYWADD